MEVIMTKNPIGNLIPKRYIKTKTSKELIDIWENIEIFSEDEVVQKIITFIQKYRSYAQEAKRSHTYVLCLIFRVIQNKNLSLIGKALNRCSSRLNNIDCLHLMQTIYLIQQGHNEGTL
jgi:hypothetical protein